MVFQIYRVDVSRVDFALRIKLNSFNNRKGYLLRKHLNRALPWLIELFETMLSIWLGHVFLINFMVK